MSATGQYINSKGHKTRKGIVKRCGEWTLRRESISGYEHFCVAAVAQPHGAPSVRSRRTHEESATV